MTEFEMRYLARFLIGIMPPNVYGSPHLHAVAFFQTCHLSALDLA